MSILDKFLGDANERKLKEYHALVEKINQLEPEFGRFSNEKIKAKTAEFRERLSSAVKKNTASGLLLGGLDSGLLAYLCPDALAITVTLESRGKDLQYAESLAQFLNIEHYHREVSIEEAIETIPTVIKILRSFDPAVLNDLTVYFV